VGFPILSRDTHLQNFYHAVGMNGHGMTIHAAIARAMTGLLLQNTTMLDISDVVGKPASLDFSVLNAARFARGELLNFNL
jgi:glycine/D-amino acid oxidase-like deaminating enzyme